MKKTIHALIAVVILQVLLAIALQFRDIPLTPTDGKPLVAATLDEIDRIEIESGGGTRVVLTKADKVWRLPDLGGFPADGQRVSQFMSDLNRIAPNSPMASSTGAQDRFKVGEKNFDRRITLGGGDKTIAVLYLGTPQGLRDTPVRRAGEKNIYAIRSSALDVQANNDSWADMKVLQLPKDSIARIDVDGLVLHAPPKTGPNAAGNPSPWRAEGLKSGETLDSASADNLASLLANISPGGILKRGEQPDNGLDRPLLTLALTTRDGRRIDYAIGKLAGDEAYTLKTSSRAEIFRLLPFAAQPLLDTAKRTALLGKPAPQDKPGT